MRRRPRVDHSLESEPPRRLGLTFEPRWVEILGVDAGPASEDGPLLEAWRAGDRQAGQALFERYYPMVARFFCNKVADGTADLVQRTFLACVEGAERFEGRGTFRSYVFSVAYKTLCKHFDDRRRGEAREEWLDQSVQATNTSPFTDMARREEQRLVLEGLRRIPIAYQVVLELHYWEKLSGSEIAAALDLPEGTVRTRLRRGRALLEAEISALASSPELLQTTRRNLDDWAAGIRDEFARGSE